MTFQSTVIQIIRQGEFKLCNCQWLTGVCYVYRRNRDMCSLVAAVIIDLSLDLSVFDKENDIHAFEFSHMLHCIISPLTERFIRINVRFLHDRRLSVILPRLAIVINVKSRTDQLATNIIGYCLNCRRAGGK